MTIQSVVRWVMPALLLCSAGGARGEALRGRINGWGTNWMATNSAFIGDTRWAVTVTSTQTMASNMTFKVDLQGDWTTNWGTGSSSTNAAMNSTIGQGHKSNVTGSDNGNLTYAGQTNGMRYTFRMDGDHTWWYRPYVVQVTTNDPVTVADVSDNSAVAGTNAVTVTARLSAPPSGESVYARWTTNRFTNSALAVAAVSGTDVAVTIPAMPAGRTVKYYVLTSAMPTNRIVGNWDLCTLRANNAGGTNYAYLVGEPQVVLGNSWHHPSNAEPAGASMRNPPTNGVAPGAAVFFYNGTYSGESDQSGGTLHHRLQGAPTWASTNLSFDSQAGENKYWVTRIPGGTYAAGDVVEYYFGITYTDDSPTFLGTSNNAASLAYAAATNAAAHPFRFAYGEVPPPPDPVMGNCWHFPANAEPAGATMRNPTNPAPGANTYVYVGNYQGAADMTGGWVFYKKSTDGAWASNGLAWDSAAGDNAYWVGTIPADAVALGETLQYYLRADYANGGADATYLGTTTQADNAKYAQATNAAAHPFAATSAEAEPVFGNCWHFPTNQVPWAEDTMRIPTNPAPTKDTWIYVGNYQGAADMTGGAVVWRAGAGNWATNALAYVTNAGSDNYWSAKVASNAVALGEPLEYFLRVDYANGGAGTTYLGTTTQVDNVKYAQATNAAAHPFAATSAEAEPVFGNCWHFPTNAEPAGATMRNPATPSPSSATHVYVGNYQGAADMTGGWVFYKKSTDGAWSSNSLAWDSTTGGNNAYWIGAIPSNAVALGETLQYYLQADYANGGADATFLGTTTQADNAKYAQATNAAAHPFAAVSAAHLGNCWHVPTNAEPTGAYMRNPRHPYADSAVTIYSGNQAGGAGGNPGDQSGGTLHYRLKGAGSWSSAPMAFDAENGYNKYWSASIPAGAFGKTQTVEYVLAATYTDHDATFLGLASNSVASQAFATLEEAQAKPFDFTYGGDPGTEPGYVWHGGNTVKISGDTLQVWVKTGYKNGADRWADHAEVRYRVAAAGTRSSTKQGVRAFAATGARAPDATLTNVVAMTFDHEEEDSSANGNAMWWVATIVDPALAASADSVLRYQIAAWKSATNGGNGVERLAEYQADGVNDRVFEYRMQSVGANALTVNGQNADYTTSKLFIDEALGETARIRATYAPPSGATDVQIFSNVGRRDFWNADLDGNGVADAIRPPSGELIATGSAGYYAAHAMAWDAGEGAYVWEADIGKCGAYRLTARYHVSGDTNWHYYSEMGSGIRDHAVVISPKKVLQQSIYELNALSAKASAATEDGRSTFASLIETSEGNRGTFDEFGVEYLNKIQANCLWFQPIHTSSEYGLGAGGEPGSPYSAKDYFAVSKWFGREKTTASALTEFQQFVAACDAGKSAHMATSYVGTINIMLDGVFNHTSWDAVFGEMGERLGIVPAGQGAGTAIGSLRPGWFANYSDYGAPATFYHGPAGGQHDIASAPDRGDFGKWLDTAELFYGNYSALVRHNPDNNGDYLNEGDWYDYTSMTAQTEELWNYMGSYPEFWLGKTGHSLTNRPGAKDANGVYYDDYGIDGLRCDFGQGLPPQFWEYIVNRTRAAKWNFMFMAESLDGGKVSYRSNRHFDILNESFVFQMVGAGSPGDVKNAVESRKNLYAGGAVLLNLTSHDEVMPYSDPWTTASRFAMVSSIMGLPMTFYGQEQGIVPCEADKSGKVPGDSVDGNAYNGFAQFELNMGKWVPHFKNWNKLLVWEDPPSAEWSRQMAQWYGRVNWARLNSPALQSGNQYFLGRKHEGTYDNGKIFAVAKVEEPGAVAKGKDAVLAFSLFVNVGAGGHAGANDTYDLAACWDLLGLTNSASVYYNVRNLASSAAQAAVWPTPKSGAELYNDGIWVSFDSDGGGRAIHDDGAIVQFLKIEQAAAPGGTETTNSPVPVPHAWLAGYFGAGHTPQEYEQLAMQGAANGALTVWEMYVANLDPTDPAATFQIAGMRRAGPSAPNVLSVPVEQDRAYRIEYSEASLTNRPMVWSSFQSNGTWTNRTPYTNLHEFADDGTAGSSGAPLGTSRTYRVWVGLP